MIFFYFIPTHYSVPPRFVHKQSTILIENYIDNKYQNE